MDKLSAVSQLVIAQKKEWGEVLLGFEGKNRYVVVEPAGGDLYAAVEASGSLIRRFLLRGLRPFTIEVLDLAGQPVLRVERPFRFYFHEASVTDASGRPLGSLRREFALLRRVYTVTAPTGDMSFSLFGRLLRPWTFEIRKNGRSSGKIAKKWSGALKEGFTDADNFSLVFDPSMSVDEKAFFLGAVFLIDFVHFES